MWPMLALEMSSRGLARLALACRLLRCGVRVENEVQFLRILNEYNDVKCICIQFHGLLGIPP